MHFDADLDRFRSPLAAQHLHLLVYEFHEMLHLIQDGLNL
jgi:hypothetical protein